MRPPGDYRAALWVGECMCLFENLCGGQVAECLCVFERALVLSFCGGPGFGSIGSWLGGVE